MIGIANICFIRKARRENPKNRADGVPWESEQQKIFAHPASQRLASCLSISFFFFRG